MYVCVFIYVYMYEYSCIFIHLYVYMYTQADSLLCEHTPWRIHDFDAYDYVGAPWRQEECPPGASVCCSVLQCAAVC